MASYCCWRFRCCLDERVSGARCQSGWIRRNIPPPHAPPASRFICQLRRIKDEAHSVCCLFMCLLLILTILFFLLLVNSLVKPTHSTRCKLFDDFQLICYVIAIVVFQAILRWRLGRRRRRARQWRSTRICTDMWWWRQATRRARMQLGARKFCATDAEGRAWWRTRRRSGSEWVAAAASGSHVMHHVCAPFFKRKKYCQLNGVLIRRRWAVRRC